MTVSVAERATSALQTFEWKKMSGLKDKVVVVIGGSSGIGLRVAELAAQQEAKVVITGRDPKRLANACESLTKYGARLDAMRLDAHKARELEYFFSSLPEFDHLVSMVGDVMGGGFLQADMDVFRHVIESKFFTNVRIGRLAARKVREGGSLIFTSGSGGRAQDACASYVGNLGIQALVEGLAVEMAPRVRVNTVAPTWTLTPFWRDVHVEQLAATREHFENVIPLRRLANVDEIAGAYIFLMNNGFLTGQRLAVDGGIMLGA